MTIEAIAAADLPDFVSISTSSLAVQYLGAIVFSCSLISQLLVLFALLKKPHIIKSSTDVFIFFLTLNQIGVCVPMLSTSIFMFVRNGFALGKTGCVIQGLSVVSFAFADLSLLIAITLERYMLIVRNTKLSPKHATIISIVILATGWLFAMIPIFGGFAYQYYSLIPGRTNCLNGWNLQFPAALFMSILSLVAIVSPFPVIAYGYFQIYNIIRINNLNMKELDSSISKNSIKQNQERDKLEARVLLQMVTLTVFFAVSWVLEGVQIFYQIATGLNFPVEYDLVAIFMGCVGVTSNAYIILYFNLVVRKRVVELLRKLFIWRK